MNLSGRPWAGRSHADLADLTRELLLAGHLIDRAGMPAVIARLGRQGMEQVAVEEWRAASPVYTRRMQALLGFEGDSVEVIFKGMQLDVGAPPEFMDFRYEVIDHDHGRFHLDHCGALMDVEPMGDEYVQAMCHSIEDPTFDATAAATNPRARMRPVHRPPRVPSDRAPHCEWTVSIDPDAEPLALAPSYDRLASCAAAQLPLAEPDSLLSDDDGRGDYAGNLDPDLAMNRFSSAALSMIADEVALQGQLLARAFLLEVAERVDAEDALSIGIEQAAGIAGLTTKRLAAALGASADLDGLAAVLAVHPLLLPRGYVPIELDLEADSLSVALLDGPGTSEDDGLTWPALLAGRDGDVIVEAAAVCLVPNAAVERVDARTGEAVRWAITIDPAREPVEQPTSVTLAEFSTGATFVFVRHTPKSVANSVECSPL